jgi:hypothetical protein
LHQCLLLPVETGDIARNVLYGALVNQSGVGASLHPLTYYSQQWSQISWALFPFSYPPIALAFFSFVAAVSPTIAAAKIVLTAFEAANALLIRRLSGSTWVAVAYWASPLSIWWVSREGQFEPVQAFFSLIALLTLSTAPLVAGLAIALAVGTKVTAGALIPYILWRSLKTSHAQTGMVILGALLGFLPVIFAEIAYGAGTNVLKYGALLRYNPYYWNLSSDMFAWNSSPQIVADQIATWTYLIVLVWYLCKDRFHPGYLAAIAFLVFCKTHSNVQFWYMLLLPSFLMAIPRSKLRGMLVVLCPLLDIRGSMEAFHGPFEQKTFHGLPSVYDRYG